MPRLQNRNKQANAATETLANFIRGRLRPSRLMKYDSLFISTSKIFTACSSFFSTKKAFVLTSRPSELSFYEHALSSFSTFQCSFLNIYTLHPFSSYFIHIKNSSYTKFSSFSKLQPFSYDSFFYKFNNRFFSNFDYFCRNTNVSSFSQIFYYNNFYTHFSNKIARKSMVMLVSVKRHCDARSNFFYYN